MRIVAALGGNALLERGERPDAAVQLAHIRRAAAALAPLTTEHELVVCHGNGPQVGLLAIESEADTELREPYPLDALGAQTQGMIGYWLTQALRNAGVARPVVSVVTQVVVDESDPGFTVPTKFIGPIYSRHHAHRLVWQHGWTVAADGSDWRRVVASPEPRRILELPAIQTLVDARIVTVCTGGGGAPVLENESGQLRGADAIVDKDLTAALLARDIQADVLLLLTDVAAVMRDYSTDHATPIARIDVAGLKDLSFPAGSMGPKIEACTRFVEATHGYAGIGALTDVAGLLDGSTGTTIVADPGAPPADRHFAGTM